MLRAYVYSRMLMLNLLDKRSCICIEASDAMLVFA